MSRGLVGALRVAGILTRTALRRELNRVQLNVGSVFRRRRRETEGRQAPPRPGSRNLGLLLVFGALLMLNGLNIANLAIWRISGAATTQSAARAIADAERGGDAGARARRVAEELQEIGFGLPGPDAWPVDPGAAEAMRRSLGALMALLFLTLLFLGLSMRNRELSQPGWSMEWHFTFPVPAGGLFLARQLEYTLTNLFGWFTCFPFLLVYDVSLGFGWWSVPLALAGTLHFQWLLAACRVLIETLLRKRLALHRLKNVQAGCSLVGLLFFFLVAFVAVQKDAAAVLVDVAGHVGPIWGALPSGVAILAPQLLLPALVLALVYAVAFGWGAVGGAAVLVRDGLVAAAGPYRGRRAAPSTEPGRRFLRGVVAKDVRLLLRDKNLLMQTLGGPMLVILFQIVMAPDLLDGGKGLGLSAMIAFAVGAYVLVFGAFSALAVESDALWLHYTFPRRLLHTLRHKALLWGGLGAIYSLIMLTFQVLTEPGIVRGEWVALVVLVLYGVGLFAFLATTMGALGTDPYEKELHRRIRPAWMLLYMALAGAYGAGLTADSWWARIVTCLLFTFFAAALWERVAAHLPRLLDPAPTEPRGIATSDGVLAVLVFYGVLVLTGTLAVGVLDRPSGVPLVPYLAAGGTAVILVGYGLKRSGIPDLDVALGLRGGRGGVAGRLLLGVGAGIAAAALAWLYLQCVPADWTQKMSDVVGEQKGQILRFAILVVVVAPVLEELMFRGLLFRGMRARHRVPAAAVASAVVFALVHPPLSVLPVFGLGLVCALCFERTRWLPTAMVAHATYNGLVLAMQF